MTSLNRRVSKWAVALSAVFFWTSVVTCAGVQAAPASGPDLSIGADRFPDADAIILRWEQHWTLNKDGTIRRRDHKWTKLLNTRPIRALADPRIDTCTGEDELTIHVARTHLPGGGFLPVADYSFNKAGPDDVAGWPEYSCWEQTVISFGGIENNCVLELDYEIVTRPGVMPWLEGDLRLRQDYPTVERIITVTVPEETDLKHRVDGFAPIPTAEETPGPDGMKTYRWTFSDLAGSRAESFSPPWYRRCARVRFTNCPDADAWFVRLIECAQDAVQVDESIKAFAEAVVEDEADLLERVRLVAEKLQDSFNFIHSPKSYRSLTCRKAPEVLRANYGNSFEAAALLAAALQSLGMKTEMEAVAKLERWHSNVPTLSGFDGITVMVRSQTGSVRVHPEHGLILDARQCQWGRRLVGSVVSQGQLRATRLRARGEERPSKLQITGKVSIDTDGAVSGDLRLLLTGLFYDPRKLETAKQQEALVKDMVGRVLTGCEVTDYSIGALSEQKLKATVKVASKGALKQHAGHYLLQLGDGPAFLGDIPMPLAPTVRKTNIDVAGRFDETVTLTIELPETWTARSVPASFPYVRDDWGYAEQTVVVDGRVVRFQRKFATAYDRFPFLGYIPMRDAINTLKAEGYRTLIVGPAAE